MGNNSFTQYVSYLIMLSVCIDRGDGRWKERDRENIQHDITIYKEMAEKLEHEIEAFYEEYPGERLSDENTDRIHNKYLTNLLNRDSETPHKGENKDRGKHSYPNADNGSHILLERSTEKTSSLKVLNNQQQIKTNDSSKDYNKSSAWPKFEDILLSVGRKYDWKNDRWIKVKEKPKIKTSYKIKSNDNKVDFHEKHKFSYTIVKLNRSKSRRNVVVAVSAVR